MVNGRQVPIPFNLHSTLALIPPRMADRLCEALVDRFGFLSGTPGAEPLLITEYPEAFVVGVNEPHHPIPSTATAGLFNRYRSAAATLEGRLLFAGRLGDFACYSLAHAWTRVLALFEKRIAPMATGGLAAFRGERTRIAVSD
jgi:UDP-galactopyranose mutase